MTYSRTKEALRKQAQRAKKAGSLSADELKELKKKRNEKDRRQHLAKKAKLAPEMADSGLAESEAWAMANANERSVLKTLATKGNKMGLRDRALKMGLDEYRERLESGGQTKEELAVDQFLDREDRATDKRLLLKRRIRSLL